MSGIAYFFCCLGLLIAGYAVYGVIAEKVFGVDRSRPTPVMSKADGMDYVPMPTWKLTLIQFLNIAGLGPVFGPIVGALYGPAALLWVVFGCIFAGAVHDFISGMMSLRYGGASYPEIISRNLGEGVRKFMVVFTLILLIMVGAVFTSGPAALLASISPLPLMAWSAIIFIYYICATILPINVLIGRIYPFFAALLIFLKSILSLPPMLLVGYPLRVSILAAMSLAQIGEFSFVLARSAVNSGLMDNDGYQMFLAASIVTMMLTPTVMEIAPKVASFVSRHMHMPVDEEAAAQRDESLKDHLIIVGFGVGGKHLARTAREAGIPYVILEMNPDTVSRYGGKEPIHGGDASKPLVLEHFGIQSARVIAVVISDPSAVRAITAVARKLNPKVHIVVRTRFLGEVDALRRLGADDVIPEDFETSIEIFSRVLGHYLVPRQTIERFVNSIRHEYYNMARQLRMTGMDLPSLADEVLTGLEVVACKVEPGCALDGKRLMDTSLRKKYGVTVVGIRHAGQIIPSPGGDAFLHGDDTVFLFASPASLTTVMPFFRTDPEPERAEDL